MIFSPVASTTATTTNSSSNSTASNATDASAMQDRFLKLLVAQLNNQDPMNPLDNRMAVLAALTQPLDSGTQHFEPSNLEVTSVDVGNPTTNVIPAKAAARFNVRFNDHWTAETLKAEIDARLARASERRDRTAPIAHEVAWKRSSPVGARRVAMAVR